MVHLLDVSIADDPTIRRLQLVEAVLSHCAKVLWPKKPERWAQATQWAAKISHAVQKHAQKVAKNHSRPRTPDDVVNGIYSAGSHHSVSKAGRNGIQVASADVLVVKDSGSRGSSTRQTPEKRASATRTAQSNGCMPSHSNNNNNTNTNNNNNGGGPSPLIDMDCIVQENSNYRETTAALTPDGSVVLVTSTGSPLMEADNMPYHGTLPLEVKRLSGGITNELFHVYDPEDATHSVVVRVFGKETERVISRESELFYQSLFIPTYVHGANFLIYEYLANHETLPYTDMAKESRQIADAMAEFQVRATLAAVKDRNKPLLREEQNERYWSEAAIAASRFERESNYTVHSLTTWVDQVSQREILDKVHPDKQEEYVRLVNCLREESDWLMSLIETQRNHLGEGVCHNDLLSANIMRHTETGSLKIIDFDYTKRDFLLFDIANHFNEYTGLECDYKTYFPQDDHITLFIRQYRESMRAHLSKAHAADAGNLEIIPGERELFWTDGGAREEDVVAHWTALVKLLTLCSNVSWSTWSMLQEAVSALDVDFLDYAKLRLARYHETKDAFAQSFA